jgi:hypothetical protein
MIAHHDLKIKTLENEWLSTAEEIKHTKQRPEVDE